MIEAVPHLHVRHTREQLIEHVAEGVFPVVERALPVRFDHDQPDQPRPRQRPLPAEHARGLSRLRPFAACRIAAGIEFKRALAGKAR